MAELKKDWRIGNKSRTGMFTAEFRTIPGIYTITNLINGKMYVGKTKNLQNRKTSHFSILNRNIYNSFHLQKAFNKYGEDNFKFETLVECPEELLYSEEHYWCNLLNVHNSKFGYNIKPTHPEGKGGITKEGIAKMKLKKGKSVICLTKDGNFVKKYRSAIDAGEDLDIKAYYICNIARGIYKYYKKYIFVYEKDYDVNKDYSINNHHLAKTVIMYDTNMIKLKEFKSMTEAAKFIRTSPQNLCVAISENRQRKGYYWKFKQN